MSATSASLMGSTTKKMKLDANQSVMHWSARLDGLIKTIEPLGSFVHQETLCNMPQMLPRVSVDGIGRLGFPMPDMFVDALITASTKAPYGHLEKTLMDTKVRDAWQIDATQVTIGSEEAWTTYFTKTVRKHCFHLGISNERFERMGIQAKLYKMLIYEEGGHFLSHRDTEKEAHMFGTLLLQLPTSEGYEGGELAVSHIGATKTLDLSIGSDNEFHSVSFYADCNHELHPVTKGKRVCLVYSLVATSPEKSSLPSHDINVETEQKLRSIVDDWKRSGDSQKIMKIGHQLEHKYTRQSIGFSTLKGQDEIVAATLRNARDPHGMRLLRVSLLLMEHYCDSLPEWGEISWDKPTKVIEETPDGTFEETFFKHRHEVWNKKEFDERADRWQMLCHSRNGWWVTPDVNHKDVITENEYNINGNPERKKDSNDERGNNDDDDKVVDDVENKKTDENSDDESTKSVVCDRNGVEFDSDRQMFLSTCDVKEKENALTGNEGGSLETWYYAAAFVISPSSFFGEEGNKVN